MEYRINCSHFAELLGALFCERQDKITQSGEGKTCLTMFLTLNGAKLLF